MLHFDEASHTYTYDGRKLVSVTQFLGRFFEVFDGPRIARRVVTNPNSKYHSKYRPQLSLYRHLLREQLQDRNVSLLLVNFTDRYTEIPIREHRDEVRALLMA